MDYKKILEKIKGLCVKPLKKEEPEKVVATKPLLESEVTMSKKESDKPSVNAEVTTTGLLSKPKSLELLLRRVALEDEYTIGRLYVLEGNARKYLMDTLEDKVRDTNKNGVFDNGEQKVYGQTAIPYGDYVIDMNRVSPKFKLREWGKRYGGIVPYLKNVPSFEGILIHPGNSCVDTSGCILVGDNNTVGRVSYSQHYYYELMDKYLMPAKNKGMKIILHITD